MIRPLYFIAHYVFSLSQVTWSKLMHIYDNLSYAHWLRTGDRIDSDITLAEYCCICYELDYYVLLFLCFSTCRLGRITHIWRWSLLVTTHMCRLLWLMYLVTRLSVLTLSMLVQSHSINRYLYTVYSDDFWAVGPNIYALCVTCTEC